MKTTTTTTLAAMVVMAAAALVAGGCAAPENGKPFFPDDKPRTSRAVQDAQAANGAAEDAMLYPRHFDGGQLSDLGKDKLYRMAESSYAGVAPLTVYLNLPEPAATAERKDAVVAYLKAAGLTDERIAVKVGPNAGSARLATLTAGKLYEIRPEGAYSKSLGTSGGGAGPSGTTTEESSR